MRPIAILFISLGLFLLSIEAWSQTRSKNALAAERLFKMGLADMYAGKFETACPLLAQSQELDPHHGTLVACADCEDRAGHLATAFNLYEEYLSHVASMTEDQKKRHASRAKKAEIRREELRSLIPRLRIILPPFTPRDTKIWLNGSELAPAMLALEVPLNPGEYIVVLKQTDGASSEKRVTLKSGDRVRLELELPPAPSSSRSMELKAPNKQKRLLPMKKEPKPTQHTAASPAHPSLADSPPIRPIPPAPEKGSWHRSLGGLSLGAGGACIGVGTVMGLIALVQQGGARYGDTFTDVSIGAFIAGGMFSALGVGLLLWSPDNPKPPTASIPPLQLGILQASPTSFMLGAQGTIF